MASEGQGLISGPTGGACAMEVIFSAAEMGFTGSLVGSNMPFNTDTPNVSTILLGCPLPC